jgi:glutathione S-transferase
VAYVEERWAVGVHALLARRLASATTLPILDGGTEIIQGSDRILDWTGLKGGNPEIEERFQR